MAGRFSTGALRSSLEKAGFTCDGHAYAKGSVLLCIGDLPPEEHPCRKETLFYHAYEHEGLLIVAEHAQGALRSQIALHCHPPFNPPAISRALRALQANPSDPLTWQRLFAGYDGGWYVAADVRRMLAKRGKSASDTDGSGYWKEVMIITAAAVLYHQGDEEARLQMDAAFESRGHAGLCCVRALCAALGVSDGNDLLGTHSMSEGAVHELAKRLLSIYGTWEGAGLHIDTFVFGAVFEQLQAMSARKEKGVYYTPRLLAKDTAARCMRNINRVAGGSLPIRVLDPSCGSGHFLEACLDAMADAHGSSPLSTKQDISGIHGVDIDWRAVWVTRIRLALVALRRGAFSPECVGRLVSRIRCGDALLPSYAGDPSHVAPFSWDSYKTANGVDRFDIIIGNPPYGKVKNLPITTAQKDALSRRYRQEFPSYRGNIEFYKLFLLRALTLAAPDTIISFVIPSTFWGDKESHRLRKCIIERGCFYLALLGIEDSRLFFGSDTHYELSVFAASGVASGELISYLAPSDTPAVHIRHSTDTASVALDDLTAHTDLQRVIRYDNPRVEAPIFQYLCVHGVLGDHIASRVGVIDETMGKDNLSCDQGEMMALSSTHIKDWYVDLDPSPCPKRWACGWERLSSRKVRMPDGVNVSFKSFLGLSNAVVGRQMAHRGEKRKLHFALHPGMVVPTNGVRIVYATGDYSPEVLCALLNSATYNWLFSRRSHTYNVKPYELGELPAPKLAECTLRALEALSGCMHILAAARAGGEERYSRAMDDAALLLDTLVFEALFSGDTLSLSHALAQCLYRMDSRAWVGRWWETGCREGQEVAIDAANMIAAALRHEGVQSALDDVTSHPWVGICLSRPHNAYKWPRGVGDR